MEMVKYLALTAIVLGSLVVGDVAQARGRHGCASCQMAAGCPGGVCAMPAAPAKMAATAADTSVAPVAAAPAAQPAAAATGSAPRYYANMNRGLFGRRR